ncbi:MAG: hypothetical protein QOJ63_1528 [Solirubrobacteraceae bacterium]|nr:hypothetical protein [Solirubrobacteraceae bacterium]
MRPPNALVGSAALVALALFPAAAAVASAGGAPGPTFSGGARYGSGVPRPAVKPVASRLTVSPRSVVAGQAPPRVRFRVRQRGIEHVQARIVVVRLPRRAAVARMSLGWVHTGRQVAARWPRGVALRAGHYLVQLHVKDSRGHTLRRSALHPGRTRIVVRGLRRKAPPPVVARPPVVAAPPVVAVPRPPPATLPAPAASPGGPGIFPVAGAFDFGGVDGRFGAGRPGHIHQGQDILATAGTPVVAPYGGTVLSTSFQKRGAGEYVVLAGVDGRSYFFAHCIRRSTAVAEDAAVAAGQQLCQVGSTGTASGSHLHFEIWSVGWRIAGGFPIDPLPELRAWARR